METTLAENGRVSVIGIVCGGCFNTSFVSLKFIENKFDVCWTMHHCDNWGIKTN